MNFSFNSLNASGIWFFVFSIFYLLLTLNVIRMRWATKTGLGLGEDRRLLKAIRIHGNFSEYIPIVFIGIILMEVRGADENWLHSLYSGTLVGRILITIGITKTHNFSLYRFFGNTLTFLSLITAGTWNLFQSIN